MSGSRQQLNPNQDLDVVVKLVKNHVKELTDLQLEDIALYVEIELWSREENIDEEKTNRTRKKE